MAKDKAKDKDPSELRITAEAKVQGDQVVPGVAHDLSASSTLPAPPAPPPPPEPPVDFGPQVPAGEPEEAPRPRFRCKATLLVSGRRELVAGSEHDCSILPKDEGRDLYERGLVEIVGHGDDDD